MLSIDFFYKNLEIYIFFYYVINNNITPKYSVYYYYHYHYHYYYTFS